ncbi:hypothetical protein [Microbacterium sp. CR_7]|uniref:hypothetical protein n=1 Tax=Microbacterium sp. CR_7 TaxID=3055792 RepID=UPI0035BFE9AD
MSPLDIIPIPNHPGMYARRVLVEAWQAAGAPPINSAGRLYDKQKYFYDGWVNRLPGFNPADNPDDESQALAHVRFVALDIDPTPERVQRLAAAGLRRPYRYEPWHWELPNVRSYAIVRSIPTTAGGATPAPIQSEEDDMRIITWNGRVWLVKHETCAYVRNEPALWAAKKLTGQGTAIELSNDMLTETLFMLGIPWAALDATFRGQAFDNESTWGKGTFWSRQMAEGREDKLRSQSLASSIAALAVSVTTHPGA